LERSARSETERSVSPKLEAIHFMQSLITHFTSIIKHQLNIRLKTKD